jgi:DNA ligase-4
MNKGVYDIIRPRWLFDSIASNELVPMSKKYFFHATAERMESEDYYNEDDDLDSRSPKETSLRMSVSPGIQVDAEVPESKEEDSEMQEWLKIGPGSDAAENPGDDADSVTDPDSGNEDDNWFSVEAPQLGGAGVSGMEVSLCVGLGGLAFTWKYQLDTDYDKYEQVNVKGAREAQMGEDSAMEYDQERIFRHLYVLF